MMEKFVATEIDNQKRLDVFLSENTSLSRSQIKLLNDQNKVFLNGKNVKAGEKIKQSDIIEIEPEQKPQTDLVAQNIGLDIVFEDQNLAGGYKQLLSLAGTILHKPQLLILDEPTSALLHSITPSNTLLAKRKMKMVK